ncbi:unnamed protein product [Prunus armeniaca]|uniref:Uncharacterized protein n=1 Tax=Prunus armeniaca TaxID=36596 RepID=A0A6J5TTN1_PRUAR|nr:unnamed protein product [Prunus armeniaca]
MHRKTCVTVTDRKTVEEKADQILTAAAASDVAFLVVGRSFWLESVAYYSTTMERQLQFHSSLKVCSFHVLADKKDLITSWSASFMAEL